MKKSKEWLPEPELRSLLEECSSGLFFSEERPGKLQLPAGILFKNAPACNITVPPVWPQPEAGAPVSHYLDSLAEEPPSRVLMLVQAGYGALGCWTPGRLLHRSFSRYMVRRGQGKAQLTYRKEKGKSRLGSRIRLQQSVKFFADISDTLAEWEDDFFAVSEAQQIWLGVPVRLSSELWQSNTPPPFPSDDPRIRRVPFTVQRPSFAGLKRINFMLTAARVEIQPDGL